jgi:ribosomal protein S18 acetylase RimI-like enzyme
MRQSLERDISAPYIPQGFRVRPFQGEIDLEQWARVQWNAFTGGAEPSEWMREGVRRFIAYSRVFPDDVDLGIVADDGYFGAVAHIMMNTITGIGEFEPVATHQAYQRKGLGRALLTAGLRIMQDKGMKIALVRTGLDNLPAIGLYEAVGFQVVDHLHGWHKA